MFIVDGSVGLHRSQQEAYGKDGRSPRAYLPQGGNVKVYLPTDEKDLAAEVVAGIRAADTREANAALDRLAQALQVLKDTAARSLVEGLERSL